MRDEAVKDRGGDPKPVVRCMVKNCNKALAAGEAVRIGEKVFCKRCSVAYLKGALGL